METNAYTDPAAAMARLAADDCTDTEAEAIVAAMATAEAAAEHGAALVRPDVSTRVRVVYGTDHVIEGVVIDVDDDSILIAKHAEFDDDAPLSIPEGEAWTLYDVEQSDALCVVSVL